MRRGSGRRRVTARWALPAIGFALLAGAVSAGCQKPAGDARLEKFLAAHKALPRDQQEAVLRAKVAGGGQQTAFAHYALGNLFYAAAGDSAAAGVAGAVALYDSARVHLERAAALDTTFVEAQVNLGSVWDDMADQAPSGAGQADRLARQAQAEAAYRRALALRPTDEKARCNLGALYLKKRKPAEAIAEFRQALADNPRSALAHYNLAIMFAESKMYREALHEWEAAAKADPRGDIGQRSRDNVKIVRQLMTATTPATPAAKAPTAQTPSGH